MTAPDLHAGYDELAVGHALGALEPAEAEAFLRHLAGCARCERAVADSLETMSHLAYAADTAAPPAGLWDAIRAGVEASGREVSFPDTATGTDFGTAEDAPAAAQAPVADLAAARGRRTARGTLARRAAALTSVAAGFAVVAALVTQNVALRDREQPQLAVNAGVKQALSAFSSDARRVALTGDTTGAPPVVAVVEGDRVHLVVDSLMPNDRARSIYVLWEQHATGDVRAVGTFDVTGDRDVQVVQDLRLHDADQLRALLVTREEGREAPVMTTERPVAQGTLA